MTRVLLALLLAAALAAALAALSWLLWCGLRTEAAAGAQAPTSSAPARQIAPGTSRDLARTPILPSRPASTPALSPGQGEIPAASAPAATTSRPAPAVTASTPTPAAPAGSRNPTARQWAELRWCESGALGYRADTGNGYHGAYQFDLTTWASVGGRGDPASAPPAEQDTRALALYNLRGAQPWPACGRWLR